MKDCYINGLGSISAQRTYEGDFLEHVSVNDYANVIYADQPSYKEVIPPAAIKLLTTKPPAPVPANVVTPV